MDIGWSGLVVKFKTKRRIFVLYISYVRVSEGILP